MIATLLFALFLVTMLLGVPIGASLGPAGAAALAPANAVSPLFGLLAAEMAYELGKEGKHSLLLGLAVTFFVIALVFAWRSFYKMRIESDGPARASH